MAGYYSPLIRVWANETRAQAGAKSECRDCDEPITWFVTVANGKNVPIDGHDPVPHRTERDQATGRTIEVHHRDTLHFNTCEKRQQAPGRSAR